MTGFGRTAAAWAVLTLAGVGPTSGSAAAAGAPPDNTGAGVAASTPHHPSPSHFTRGVVDNPWFPLRPGNRLVYRGMEDGLPARDVVFTTYRTKVIDGVICRVEHDRLFLRGHLRERTTDWYAQTRRGTVWYFGEHTVELNRQGQVVSREGSWQSGRDGAEAGIFMPAHPRVGQTFMQENYPGHAEDRFRILSLHAHVAVPVLTSDHALLTRETTPLEPGVVDHKYYVRSVGMVREATVRGGDDIGALVSITHVARR
jgi:hypothetical protein